MINVKELIENDQELIEILENVNDNKPYVEIKSMIENLNDHIFKNHCMKAYLESCEPELCTFRILNNCDYIKFIKTLYKEHKIDIITGEVCCE